ncbi:MAG: dihydropteroate synthase [Candidatus Fluviicola riflensis]|nr:MAG: dihydropteroate synthase [Candidatus Fluviicola riflensis]OGS79974.1 MAG: dihydropteroate synthase [Candidatus Fluviicola riflensis]OGS82489.1 MAG: dihydropteroate synthase [Fluviicola sp. RIFCSPHIGHO2_01_FULL_43_53]OGS88153.1 MAG: dihydropteroate synthase [Fluviicola sp. RIFCSPHIGHO2_12_FULL_43_24]
MEFLKVESNYFPRNSLLNLGGKLFTIQQPQVMGILNITPDSFYSGNRLALTDNYLSVAEKMIFDGASMLDIGGYSSRPGADNISEAEELNRVIPVIESLRKEFPEIVLSVDTFRSEVAKAAVEYGADIINDISGGELDDNMFETVAKLGCPYILMHMRGTPQTMQTVTDYDQLFAEMIAYFSERIQTLRSLGVKDIIIDPGFGFAKTGIQSLELVKQMADFHLLGCPILAGVSRKSMIYKTLNITAEEALNGTTVLNTILLTKGVTILRVHDVKEAVEAVKLIF